MTLTLERKLEILRSGEKWPKGEPHELECLRCGDCLVCLGDTKCPDGVPGDEEHWWPVPPSQIAAGLKAAEGERG